MGDRCSWECNVRRSDIEEFENCLNMGFSEGEGEVGDSFLLTDDQANYGHWEGMRKAAEEPSGCMFIGFHGEGCEYGSYAFCAIGGVFYEIPLTHDGEHFVTVDEDGNPNHAELEKVRTFREKAAEVRALLNLDASFP